MENNTYYILITSTEQYTYKLHIMLKLLSDQIENYSNPSEKNIRILVCNDDTEISIKKELLLKEINYSPKNVFLDVQDDINSTYIIDFVEKCTDMLTSTSNKNSVITACNSKYFRSCLTLITSLYKHSDNDIDVIYVFDLGFTQEEQHMLLNLKKVEFIPMIEIMQYTRDVKINFILPNVIIPLSIQKTFCVSLC